jgi:lipopolysaccharide transport system permease protein
MIWWILEPIIYMSAFYVVFGLILKRGESNYVNFLLVGLVVWKWFASSINFGSNAIVSNVGLIRQVYLPKQLFVHIALLTTFFKFLIIFTLLLLFLLLTDHQIPLSWTAIPLLILIQFLMLEGITGLIAAVNPVFPDMKIIIDNGVMLLFFLSGIFFDIDTLSYSHQQLLMLNPMAVLLDAFRDVLLKSSWPSWNRLILLTCFSVVACIVATILISALDRHYPKIILR